MIKYPRSMHGGLLWAKIEVLESFISFVLEKIYK